MFQAYGCHPYALQVWSHEINWGLIYILKLRAQSMHPYTNTHAQIQRVDESPNLHIWLQNAMHLIFQIAIT